MISDIKLLHRGSEINLFWQAKKINFPLPRLVGHASLEIKKCEVTRASLKKLEKTCLLISIIQIGLPPQGNP